MTPRLLLFPTAPKDAPVRDSRRISDPTLNESRLDVYVSLLLESVSLSIAKNSFSSGAEMMLRHLALLLSMLFATTLSQAAEITLDRPGDREFVRDNSNMLTESDKAEIVATCDKLLTDKATPIIVITIDRMSNHGGNGMRIETFARLLFDQWEIGQAELNGQLWNTGILVLVSKGDRKARIELGAGWHRDKDQICKSIIDDQIIPHFKRQDFSGGIKAGVVALDSMARELTMPGAAATTIADHSNSGSAYRGDNLQGQPHSKPQTPTWFPIAVVMVIGIAIFTGVSLYRSGASGLAWVMWAGVFAILGAILYAMANSNRNRGSGFFGGGGGGFGGGSSGGGFSGGSFGGGFSGGGGSSGSW